MTHHDDKLIEQAKETLQKRADELDDNVVTHLRAARLRATEVAARQHERPAWITSLSGSMSNILSRPVGAMVAATLVLGVATSLWVSNPAVPRYGVEDIDILASAESPEFYQDLEFYLWLEEQPRAG
jgi:hypothetical protein